MASGTTLRATTDRRLDTKDSEVGDRFTATLSEPVVVGRVVALPRGATLHGTVTAVKHAENVGGEAVLKLHFDRIVVDGEGYPLAATITGIETEREARGSTGGRLSKIGGGAVAGAILGRVVGGGSTGTLLGGAAGAAAGTAIVLTTQDRDAVLAEGSPLVLRLDEALEVAEP